MRVLLRGIHRVRKRLATGGTATYYYAWRGGPRLEGRPGEPAFMASYNEAVAAHKGTLSDKRRFSYLLDRYRDSPEFSKLAPRTQSDYAKHLKSIDLEFADFPIALFADRRCRADFLEWRDKIAKASPRQADYAWTVLARVLSWSVSRGYLDTNPCAKGGRLYDGNRAEQTWKPEDEAVFLAKASPPIALAMLMALWTGQRQGDLLNLTWFAYDGSFIRLRQGKTGRRVVIPVGGPLRTILDAERQGQPTDGKILRNLTGDPWTPDGFRASWGKTARRAKIRGLTFHDLRGTAVTYLFLAGCTVGEIATITGHTLSDVQSILDANYFSRDLELAKTGIAKLEEYRASLQKADKPLIALNRKGPQFTKKRRKKADASGL